MAIPNEKGFLTVNRSCTNSQSTVEAPEKIIHTEDLRVFRDYSPTGEALPN